MAQNKQNGGGVIPGAIITGGLITEGYREQNAQLHRDVEGYGTSGWKYAKTVLRVARTLRVSEVLDYGCGKQTLAYSMPTYQVHGYDPAFPALAASPEPCDFVVCTDVLEHIEPDLLDAVLDDLKRVIRHTGFLAIHTGAAVKFLNDGRNAHLTQEDFRYWLPKLWERWNITMFSNGDEGLEVVVTNRKN